MIKIDTGDIPCCLYTSSVKEHSSIKDYFLKFLKSNDVYGLTSASGADKILNTDFHVKNYSYFNNSYVDVVRPIFECHNAALCSLLDYTAPITIDNIWYQQYAKEGCHGWHRHYNSVFSNVYYVDLPEGASFTSFRFRNKEFHVEVKEGQILTFPSFLEHCSKPNPSEHIKTVIAFNSN